MGTRDPAKVTDWGREHGVAVKGLADAASDGEVAILCTAWGGVENVLRTARDDLAGKVLIDVTNPLRFDGDGPPGLAVSGDDSAGETVQRLVPEAKVVKCWNIVGNAFMIDPDLRGTPTMWIAGNDAQAKQRVTDLLHEVGWTDVVDLGGIDASRYLEGLAMVWIRTYFATGSGAHALALVRA